MKRKVRRRLYAHNVILLLLRNCVLAWAGHKLHTVSSIQKFENFAPVIFKNFGNLELENFKNEIFGNIWNVIIEHKLCMQ